MIIRSMTIYDELDSWIKDFKQKMRDYQRQEIGYATIFNMVARLGSCVLTDPRDLTDKQKSRIREFIEETNKYEPPYAMIKWSDEYLRYMVPKIIDETVSEPWETEKKEEITEEILS